MMAKGKVSTHASLDPGNIHSSPDLIVDHHSAQLTLFIILFYVEAKDEL